MTTSQLHTHNTTHNLIGVYQVLYRAHRGLEWQLFAMAGSEQESHECVELAETVGNIDGQWRVVAI